ncbi:unnamed protein product [Lota lota]
MVSVRAGEGHPFEQGAGPIGMPAWDCPCPSPNEATQGRVCSLTAALAPHGDERYQLVVGGHISAVHSRLIFICTGAAKDHGTGIFQVATSTTTVKEHHPPHASSTTQRQCAQSTKEDPEHFS